MIFLDDCDECNITNIVVTKNPHTYYIGKFNQEINLSNSQTVEEIKFACRFNKSVENLPPNLKVLTMGEYFNNSIDELPQGLEVLTLGSEFVIPIRDLPNSLRELKLGKKVNQDLTNLLPDGLEILVLGEEFNSWVKKFPSKLKRFVMNPRYNYLINNLPENLSIIEFGKCFKQKYQITSKQYPKISISQ